MFGEKFKARMEDIVGKTSINNIKKCCEGATIDAVRKAVEHTPPNIMVGQKSGLSTGEMSNAWADDSITKPDDNLTTWLINTKNYASFVNNGHFVNKHFVPHLFVVNGKLKYDPKKKGGIMVGVNTTYVKGYYMKEKAIKEYEDKFKMLVDKMWSEV